METATDNDLAAATFVILTFTNQKNGMRGEKIGHGATGDPLLCPKEALRPARDAPQTTRRPSQHTSRLIQITLRPLVKCDPT